MSDAARLREYIDTWWDAVQQVLVLLEDVPAQEWATPTDLPGWDVHAVVAHLAHLEAVLASGAEDPEGAVDIGEAPHATSPMARYVEQGVVARRDRDPATLIAELRTAATTRRDALLAAPPQDATAPAVPVFAGLAWTWERLLRNRALDVWMHDQDIRRALGRPGGLDARAAQHTADYLIESMGMVLAKRVGAPAGTTAVLEVAGSEPAGFTVTDQGHGERLPSPPASPTVHLAMDRETFIVLAGGRRPAAAGAVQVTGDVALGHALVEHLAVTP